MDRCGSRPRAPISAASNCLNSGGSHFIFSSRRPGQSLFRSKSHEQSLDAVTDAKGKGAPDPNPVVAAGQIGIQLLAWAQRFEGPSNSRSMISQEPLRSIPLSSITVEAAAPTKLKLQPSMVQPLKFNDALPA